MMPATKRKLKIWLISILSAILASVLVLSGVGIYFKFKKNKGLENPEVIVGPLDFSIDAWDGTSVSGKDYKQNYAGRGAETITIDSASSFIYFINDVNAGNDYDNKIVYLNTNIDFQNHTIKSIGNEENPFRGTFDGGYYTLLNLNINGNGLFAETEDAEIKNIGLYNATVNTAKEISGMLIGKATNTNITNTFVRNTETIKANKIGGLVGEYISNNGTHTISNSFVDAEIEAKEIGGLVHTINTNNSSENQITIYECYHTTDGNAVFTEDNKNFITKTKVINANNEEFADDEYNMSNNVASVRNGNAWDYNSDYRENKTWADYDYLEGSQQLSFNHRIQSGFVKVYMTGSYIETFLVSGDTVFEATNLTSALKEANTAQGNQLNLLVEKIFLEEQATITNANVQVNALKDTTIVRGKNNILSEQNSAEFLNAEQNSGSMFFIDSNSTLVLGAPKDDDNISFLSTNENVSDSQLVIDGNREYVEENNLKTNALVTSVGGDVEIYDNVVLKDNVNNDIGYGGAVLVANSQTQPIINAEISNCSAEYAGGGICTVGMPVATIGVVLNCSTNGNGGGVACIEKITNASAVKAMAKLYGDSNEIVPLDDHTVATGTTTLTTSTYMGGCSSTATTTGGTAGYGGAIYTAYSITFPSSGTNNYTSSGKARFTNNSATYGGGAIYSVYSSSSSVFAVQYAFFGTNACLATSANTYGGALAVMNQDIRFHEYCVFTKNFLSQSSSISTSSSFAGYGGAVYAAKNVVLGKINGVGGSVCFRENGAKYSSYGTATSPSEVGACATYGGAIYASTISVSQMTTSNTNSAVVPFLFNSNRAACGGAIYASTINKYSIGSGTIFGGEMTNNWAVGSSIGKGGAIYTTTSCLLSVSGTFNVENNISTSDGGSIYSAGNVTFSGVINFTENSATRYGGAIYSAGNVTIPEGVNFTENSANSGGAIFVSNTGVLKLNGSSQENSNILFKSNTATNTGGAIYINGELTTFGNIKFEDNTAGGGGAICASGNANISEDTTATFTGNTATSGGAIYASGNVDITASTEFKHNHADERGGAIYSFGTVTIAKGVTASFTSNSATSGGAIRSLATVTVSEGATATFTSNSATDGGAIYYKTALTISGNATFSENTASNNGGATYSEGTLTTSGNATFTNNIAGNSGGAICSYGNVTISKNVNFTENTARSGGAIYVYTDVSLTLNGPSEENSYMLFQSNKALSTAGAIYTYSKLITSGNIKFENNSSDNSCGALSLQAEDSQLLGNLIFQNNSAKNTGGAIMSGKPFVLGGTTSFVSNTSGSYGGAIQSSNFTISGTATFNGNTATTDGGAINIFSSSGAVTISGSATFTENTARNGGAICSKGVLTVSGSATFNGNTATSKGGAIYDGGVLTITSGLTFKNNTAGNYGGAIYSNGDITISEGVTATFTSNSATDGGAIYSNGSVDINGPDEPDENGCYALAFTDNTATGNGGAIYLSSSTSTLTLTDIEISGNSATNGGAIYSNGSLTTTNTNYTNNSSTDTGGVAYVCGNLTITAGNISENTAAYGSAFYTTGLATLESISLNFNTTTNNYGVVYINNTTDGAQSIIRRCSVGYNNGGAGAVVYSNCNITITNTSFAHNFSTGNGGAIYCSKYALIENSSFSGNGSYFSSDGSVETITTASGGAVYATEVEILGGSFSGNKSTLSGGAVYANSVGVYQSVTYGVYQSTKFFDNVSNSEGGAIYATNIVIQDSELSYNSSSNSGGAIRGIGEITIVNSVMSENSATGTGGAIYSAGTLTISGTSTFTENSATNEGGAIYSIGDVIVSEDATASFASNSSNYGGAIYSEGTETISGNVEFTENTAESEGGAIYSRGYVTISEGITATFTSNSATSGGAIYYSGTETLSLENINFTSNTSTYNGGAIYSTSSLEIGNNVNFESNFAKNSGGAMFVTQKNGDVLNNVTISGNNVSFKSNGVQDETYTANGGAVYSGANLNITGSATFEGNYADSGSAIFNENLIISGTATFKNNVATGSLPAQVTATNITLNSAPTFERSSSSIADITIGKSGIITVGTDLTSKTFNVYKSSPTHFTGSNSASIVFNDDPDSDGNCNNNVGESGNTMQTTFVLMNLPNGCVLNYNDVSPCRGVIVKTISKMSLTLSKSEFIYSASEVTITPANFDSNIMTISGNSATEVGIHTLTIGLDSYYKWSDEVDVKCENVSSLSIEWRIVYPQLNLYDENGNFLKTVYVKNGTSNEYADELGTESSYIPSYSKTGYTFAGWWTAKTGGTKIAENGGSPSPKTVAGWTKYERYSGDWINNYGYWAITSSPRSLYRRWTVNSYTVTFDPNGGTVDPTSKTVTYDSAYGELPTPTKTGYSFAGWTGKNLVNIDEMLNDQLVKNEDGTYTLTKTSSGRFSGYYNIAIPANETITLSYSRVKYTTTHSSIFCVQLLHDDGTYSYMSLTTSKSSATLTLTANVVKFRFYLQSTEAEGNYTKFKNLQLEYGSTATGYTPYGATFNEDSIVSLANKHTLLASWTANQYTVTFDPQGGVMSTPETITVTYGEPYDFEPIAEKRGYEVNWKYLYAGVEANQDDLSYETNGELYESSDIVLLDYDHTIYAEWQTYPVNVTIQSNNAEYGKIWDRYENESSTHQMSFITCESYLQVKENGNLWYYNPYESSVVSEDSMFIPVPAEIDDIYEYKFVGWFIDDVQLSSTSYVIYEEITIEARFEKLNRYTVTFDPNGGEVSPTSKKVTYTSAYGDLPTPTRLGYTFTGWFLGETEITSSSILQTASDHTLVANWEALPSYFNSSWDNIINNALGTSNSSFKTIQFVEGTTLPEGFNANDYILVGATAVDSRTVNDSVLAYYYVDGNSKYHLAFVSPSGGTIYAPQNSNGLFEWLDSLTTFDLSNFNTSNSTSMSSMFSRCSSLTTLDVSNFNTSNATDMMYMFQYCSKLTSLDVSNFNTSNVTRFRYMFNDCLKLTTLDVSNFNTSNATNMQGMFADCSKLTELDLSNFNTSNVTDMLAMFSNCSSLTTLDVSNFNTSNVTDIGSMFKNCNLLTTIDVSNWNTSNVTYMSRMFEGCQALTTLDVSSWDTSNVTNMSYMFNYCKLLTTLDVSNWDTSNVKTMRSMFYYCSSLTALDVSNFNTSNVTNMMSMFSGCYALTTLDVSNWDISNVTDMDYMFSNCSSLTMLDVSNWNTSKVTDIRYMFENCKSLTELDLSNFDLSKITSSYCIDSTLNLGSTSKINMIKLPKVFSTLPLPILTGSNMVFEGTQDLVITSGVATTLSSGATKTLVRVNQITADANGGTIEASDGWTIADNKATKYVEYNAELTNFPTVTKIGHSASSWNTSSDGTGDEITVSSTFAEDTTIYPQWTVNQYTVTFDPQGGVMSTPEQITVTYGEPYNFEPIAEKRGYEVNWKYLFAGEGNQDDLSYETNGEQYNSSDIVLLDYDHTIWAEWSNCYVPITFTTNNAEYGKISLYGNEYSTVTRTFVTPESYFQVKGENLWYYNPDESYEVLEDSMFIPVPAEMDDIYEYKFVGWFVDDVQLTSTSYVVYESLTVEARFEKVYRSFTVTFDPYGGEVDPTSKVVQYNSPYGELPTPTREGYTFAGWVRNEFDINLLISNSNVVNNGDGTIGVTASSTSSGVSSGQTLAELCPNIEVGKTYIFSMNTTGSRKNLYLYESEEAWINGTAKTISQDDYNSKVYWYANGDNDTSFTAILSNIAICEYEITEDTILQTSGDHVLSALWTPNDYTVTFDPNGGTVDPTSKTVTYDSTYGELPTPEREGYTFAGWLVSANVTPQTNYHNYRAWADQFIDNKYTQDLLNTNTTYTIDYDVTLHEAIPDGYQAARTNQWGNVVIRTGTQEYFKFQHIGGEIYSQAGDNYTAGSTYHVTSTFTTPADLSTAVLTWYGALYGGVLDDDNLKAISSTISNIKITDMEVVTADSIVKAAGDHTLVAQWIANEYTVNFDANGGTVDPTSKTVTYDSPYGELPTPERVGYTFNGWYGKNLIDESQCSRFDIINEYDDYYYVRAYMAPISGMIFKINGTFNVGDKISAQATVMHVDSSSQQCSIIFRLWNETKSSWIYQGQNLEDSASSIATLNKKVTLKLEGIELTSDVYSSGDEIELIISRISYESDNPLPSYFNVYKNSVMVELGETATSYIPYVGVGEITAESTVVATTDHTLIAKWTVNDYNVNFDANGGTVDPTSKTVTYDSPYGELPTPTREGYTFAGWTGKNLANINVIKENGNYRGIVINDDGTIIMPLNPNGDNGFTETYITLAQLCPELKVGDVAILNFNTNSAYGKSIHLTLPSYSTWYIGTTKVITQDDLDSQVILYGNSIVDGESETHQVVITNFQIELGETATAYEPYCGPITADSIVNVPNDHTLVAMWNINQYNLSVQVKVDGEVVDQDFLLNNGVYFALNVDGSSNAYTQYSQDLNYGTAYKLIELSYSEYQFTWTNEAEILNQEKYVGARDNVITIELETKMHELRVPLDQSYVINKLGATVEVNGVEVTHDSNDIYIAELKYTTSPVEVKITFIEPTGTHGSRYEFDFNATGTKSEIEFGKTYSYLTELNGESSSDRPIIIYEYFSVEHEYNEGVDFASVYGSNGQASDMGLNLLANQDGISRIQFILNSGYTIEGIYVNGVRSSVLETPSNIVDNGSSGIVYEYYDPVMFTEDIVIRINTVPNAYTVNFEAGVGTGTMNSVTLNVDSIGQLPANTFTKEGYSFAGWISNATGGMFGETETLGSTVQTTATVIPDLSYVKNLTTTGTVTLTAQWTVNYYTINFKYEIDGVVQDTIVGNPYIEGVWVANADIGYDTSYTDSVEFAYGTNYVIVTAVYNNLVYQLLSFDFDDGQMMPMPAHDVTYTLKFESMIYSFEAIITGPIYNDIIEKFTVTENGETTVYYDYLSLSRKYSDTPIEITLQLIEPEKHGRYNVEIDGVSWSGNWDEEFTYSWIPTASFGLNIAMVELFTVTVEKTVGIASAYAMANNEFHLGYGQVQGEIVEIQYLTGTLESLHATLEEGYNFDGWFVNGELMSETATTLDYTCQCGINDHLTITAKASPKLYTVIWQDEDGTILETDNQVPFGSTPEYNGETPTKESTAQYSYEFSGWDPEVDVVKGNIIYTAQYEETWREYLITIQSNNTEWGVCVDQHERETPLNYKLHYNTIFTVYPYDADLFDEFLVINIEVYPVATENNAQYTYEFVGWFVNGEQITSSYTIVGETVIEARFTQTINKYTVTWKNEDGTVLETDANVKYGATPEYNGATPTKAKDVQYNYTFDKWSPEISSVTGNVTYTATYTAELNKYTVIWQNEDGTVLETDSVEYGATPEFNGETPTKPATAQYTYTFKEWNPEVDVVKGNIIYTATYTETINTYTVTWKNEDGTVLETDETIPYGTQPEFNGEDPTKEATAEFTFTFAGWTPEVAVVVADAIYTATYTSTINTYTVTWRNDDGTVLETDENVAYGTVPTYDGNEPTKEATAEFSYTFAGWDKLVQAVTGDITYTATFVPSTNAYIVTWVNFDGTELEKDVVEYGVTPEYNGETPTREADAQFTYTFSGWEPAVDVVTGNATYTATFSETINKYTVRWMNYNNEVLETDIDVPYGELPKYDGTTPNKPATAQFTFTFIGWSPSISKIVGDVTYTATFSETINKYTVTWLDFNGTVLETDEEVPFGTTPEFNGETPSRENTAQYTYAFAGWTPEVDSVTGHITYTATYTETINPYTITWVNYDESVLETDELVPYGTMPTYNGETDPTREADAEYRYTFAGWDPVVTEVVGNATYKATYTRTAIDYSISYELNGGLVEGENPTTYNCETEEFTLVNPTKVGYTFIGWTGTGILDAEMTVTIETGTTGNLEFTANWEANSDTAYTVYHYLENMNVEEELSTSNSTLKDTENLTGTTASEVTPSVKDYVGFTAPTTQTVVISADGSTEVYYYYTRNTYLVKVESSDILNGTVDKASVVVDYETEITVNGNKVTIGTEEFTATAKEANAQYTYAFVSWNYEGNKVLAEMTITAKFSVTTNTYTVTWVDYNDSVLEENVFAYGTMPTYNGETDPTREADAEYKYTFAGWDPVVTEVIGNATYKATYSRTAIDYSISYELNGGLVEGENPTTYNCETEEFTLVNPTKVGYTFIGWTGTGIEEAQMTVTIETGTTGNLEFAANWEANSDTAYIVYHYLENINVEGELSTENSELKDTDNLTGTTASEVTPEVKDYDGFTAPSVQTVVISADGSTEVYYFYTRNQYTVTVVSSDILNGTVDKASVVVDYETVITVEENVVTVGTEEFTATANENNAQYTYGFVGWNYEGSQVLADMTITAEFSATINTYTVTWVDDDGNVLKTDVVEYGQKPVYDGETPTKEKDAQYTYTFAGWSPEVSEVVSDATYTATYSKVVNGYTVTFITNNTEYGEVKPSSILVNYGASITVEGNVITIENTIITATATESTAEYTYSFDSWSVTPETVIEDITITANFERTANSYTVTYDANGGEVSPESGIATYNSTYGELPTPERLGYEFLGWFTEAIEGTQVESSTFVTIAEDHAIYAHWSANSYKVTYNANGGEVSPESGTVTYNSTYGELPTPERLGYEFLGWFTEASEGTKVESSTVVLTAEDHTIYAHWEIINYTITYSGIEGATFEEGENVTTYTVETETFTLKNPTMEGYTFAGWTGSNGTEPQKVVTIEQGSAGNRVYTANWLVDITIEATGVNGNIYAVEVYDESGVLLETYNESFQLIKDKTYTLKATSTLKANSASNDYQILRVYLDGEKQGTTRHSFTSTTYQNTIWSEKISASKTIKFEYFDAYSMTVNVEQNTITEAKLNAIDSDSSVVVSAKVVNDEETQITSTTYVIANGTQVTFVVNSTPAEKAEAQYTFVGFDYVVNGTSKTVGVEGGEDVEKIGFTHSNQYDAEVGIYNYLIKTTDKNNESLEFSEITIKLIESMIVTIDTSSVTSGSTTITSEDNFNKVITSEVDSVVLYKGIWKVTSSDWDFATLQAVFTGCTVLQDSETGEITIQIPEGLS